jgi:hypothetical protein
MMNILYNTSKVLLAVGLLFIYSCSEDITPSLYDLPTGGEPTPVIASFDPPNSALAGVTEVTITGSNFNPSASGNFVYFNGVQGRLLSATATQLKVVPPAIISDTVVVKVASYKSENFSNTLIYKLEPAVSEYYPFDAKIKKEFPFGIWADNQENVYVSLSALGIKKILPTETPSLVAFAPKGPETFFRAITLASDNAIYAVRGGVKGVYKVVENTTPAAFVSSSFGIADNVNDVEYDATRDVIWGGGSTGILYRIRLDKNVKKFNISGTVNAMRVAGSDLFVATRDNNEEIVWKVPIVSADSLGTPVQYFNVSTSISPSLTIGDIVVSADGDLYIGTDQTSDPIYNVHPDKSFETLYPGLINGGVYSLSWGYGNIVYMANIVDGVNKTILKIDMQKSGTH